MGAAVGSIRLHISELDRIMQLCRQDLCDKSIPDDRIFDREEDLDPALPRYTSSLPPLWK
jgi:hypothetical protein